MRRIYILFALILSLSLFAVSPASAAPLADVTNNEPVIDFPNTITFKAKITADANITSVVLEYGTDQQTCGNVIAKAYPQFTPATSVNVEWTWDMRQSGSFPPGVTIWWRWRYTDANGTEKMTDHKSIIWLDDIHPWQTISNGQLHLHYYGVTKTDAQAMLNAGVEGLKRNKINAGLSINTPINIYIYPSYEELRDAILFEPSWSGGLTVPGHNIVAVGSSGFDPLWDQNTVIHELTHVLVGHLTFSCLSYVPQWLNEGLAVYSEGPLAPQFQSPLDEAIQKDNLLSIRIISGAFAEARDTVDLSYGQSYSIVKFLIDEYGHDKMTALLTALRDGASIDDALTQTYGFNIDGLEDAWRKSIGAKPRLTSAPTVQPTPTYVPTIVPISGAPLVLGATPIPIPTSSFESQPTEVPAARTGPPLWLTLALLGFCCLFLLVVGVIILGIVVRAQNRKGGNHA